MRHGRTGDWWTIGGFIVVVVVIAIVPSKSITLHDEQYGYIVQTQDDEQSFSDRVRELVDKGIEVEDDE